MHIIENAEYSVHIGSLEESIFSKFIEKNYSNSKIVIMVDENTNDFCLEYLITSFEFLADAEVMLLPAGEENKVMEVCFQVFEALSEYGVGRRDLIINLGGGVVTDMGGFMAALYKRGVDFINIPTTLLGMIDASIGGKTGIDLGLYKNQLGVFAHPKAIFIDKRFLQTLEPREMVNGFAEALKHALIRDKELWQTLSTLDNLCALADDNMLQRIAQIKLDIVNRDPQEKGERKVLNFGHTIGHAIEGIYMLKEEPVDHGHAVALGMMVESYISCKLNKISAQEFAAIEATLLAWFPIPAISVSDKEQIALLLHNDKKNHSGEIQFVLLEGIGNSSFDNVVSEEIYGEALMYLMSKSVSLN